MNSPSRLILSPKLTNTSPGRLFLSPSQKLQQLSIGNFAGKVFGLSAPTFNFKPSNEQEVHIKMKTKNIRHFRWNIVIGASVDVILL